MDCNIYPGSYYKGDWSEGSKILFLGPDPSDPSGKSEGGMISRINTNRTYEFVSIEHLGMVKNGVEDTASAQVKKWIPSFENYTFVDNGGQTEVQVDLSIPDEWKEMFEDLWPKALEKLKEMCEG